MRVQYKILAFLLSISFSQQLAGYVEDNYHTDQIQNSQHKDKEANQISLQNVGQSLQYLNNNDESNRSLKDEENYLRNLSQIDQQSDNPTVQKEDSVSAVQNEIEWSLLFILGLFCVILGIYIEWKNEQYFIRFLRLLDFIRSNCKMKDFKRGDLVFVHGKANFHYTLADPLFNLNIEKAIIIFREIEMVQYEEKNKKNDDIDENGNLKLKTPVDAQRGTKKNDYVKKWITHRVPILNFKNQDKIQKSQKYCKFIAETDSFQMNKISLFVSNNSHHTNQIHSPKIAPISPNKNFTYVTNNLTQSKSLSPNSLLQQLLNGAGSNTAPNAYHNTLHHQNSSQSNESHHVDKVYISDFSCFEDFPIQQFNYSQLNNNEKDIIMNKVEDLRRLQITFQDWQYDTHVLFNDNEVIISRKKDFKTHLGDNKMKHSFICADEISVLGKLSFQSTLIPFVSENESVKDIELCQMDISQPLLNNRNKTLPFISTNSNVQQYKTMGDSLIRTETQNESNFRNILCFIPNKINKLFHFDENIYWGADQILNLEQLIQLKKSQFSKQVTLCRNISFILIFISMYLCLFPIMNAMSLIDVQNLEENEPFYIKLFIAFLCTLTTILIVSFPAYARYKISFSALILITISILIYVIIKLV